MKFILGKKTVISVFVLTILFVSLFSYNKSVFIDIHSGKIKRETDILFFTIKSSTETTAVSETLQKNKIVFAPEEWVHDTSLFPFWSRSYTVNFRYSINIWLLETMFETYKLDNESRLLLSLATLEWIKHRSGEWKKFMSGKGNEYEITKSPCQDAEDHFLDLLTQKKLSKQAIKTYIFDKYETIAKSDVFQKAIQQIKNLE